MFNRLDTQEASFFLWDCLVYIRKEQYFYEFTFDPNVRTTEIREG